ncbi:hypothetical protein BCR34DRAFT_595879 [Clohesyomyces aquaticus]|uniref:Uncharacterized protein n=1 Tax=Clohesyomyces aquaticus TaxID=1231657 RepID=A0A1Y2A950_9PLEO|nr:hypothetical protein BCR34DRAFT_595879 [Clohesyomyces aquaticus]
MAWHNQNSQPYGNESYFQNPSQNYNHYGQPDPYNNHAYGQHNQHHDSFNNASHNSHWVGHDMTPARPSIDTQGSYTTQSSQSSYNTPSPWSAQSSQSLYTPQTPYGNQSPNQGLYPPTPALNKKRSKREMAAQGVKLVGQSMIVGGALAAPFAVIDPFVTPVVSASVIAAGTSLVALVKICKKCNSKFEDTAHSARAFCGRC